MLSKRVAHNASPRRYIQAGVGASDPRGKIGRDPLVFYGQQRILCHPTVNPELTMCLSLFNRLQHDYVFGNMRGAVPKLQGFMVLKEETRLGYTCKGSIEFLQKHVRAQHNEAQHNQTILISSTW